MILTCPACDTKYVVKDDAIPPGGRQVRCASCKHSWHQDPEGMVAEPAAASTIDFGGPPPPSPEAVREAAGRGAARGDAEELIAGEPQPEVPDEAASAWARCRRSDAGDRAGQPADEVAMEEAPAVADEWRAKPRPIPSPVEEQRARSRQPAEEEFVGYAPIADDDEEPRRRWPLILGILVLIVAAAAAFWFLAPARMEGTGRDCPGGRDAAAADDHHQRPPAAGKRQRAGRDQRPGDQSDRSANRMCRRSAPNCATSRPRHVVHRWTIAPPARVLAPRSSASFNSAEVDVPKGGDELTVTLGS